MSVAPAPPVPASLRYSCASLGKRKTNHETVRAVSRTRCRCLFGKPTSSCGGTTIKVPVSFALTATLLRGLVWSSSANAADQENAYAPSPTPFAKRVYLTGAHLVSDAADAELTIGVYNITTTTYTAKYTINATGVANGGVVFGSVLDPGVLLDLTPANGTDVIVPCVQLITGVTANISGDLTFFVPPETGEELLTRLRLAAGALIQLEEDGNNQLEENDTTQLEETL